MRRRCVRHEWAALAVACGVALAAAPAAAQVNIESMRTANAGDGYSARAGVSLTSRTGNVDATSLEIRARTQYKRDDRTVFLIFSGDYGWQGGRQYSNQGLAHLRYVHGITRLVAAEVFAQSDYDKSRLLDARALAGGGVRLRFVDEKKAGFAVGVAAMYEHEEVGVPPGATHPARTDVARLSSYLSLRRSLNDKTAVHATGYVQPQVDDFEDVRVIGTGSLETALAGHFSLTVSLRVRHDSRPPDTIKRTDTRLDTGVVVSF